MSSSGVDRRWRVAAMLTVPRLGRGEGDVLRGDLRPPVEAWGGLAFLVVLDDLALGRPSTLISCSSSRGACAGIQWSCSGHFDWIGCIDGIRCAGCRGAEPHPRVNGSSSVRSTRRVEQVGLLREAIDDDVLGEVVVRADGNPFYVEELVALDPIGRRCRHWSGTSCLLVSLRSMPQPSGSWCLRSCRRNVDLPLLDLVLDLDPATMWHRSGPPLITRS